MLDALVLPALGLTMVGFMIFVWVAWIGRPGGRSMKIEPPSEDDIDPDERD
jgi:hypothetical protein